MRIIQLLPTLQFGDAVSNDARMIEGLLAGAGYQTGIYAENIDPRLPDGAARGVQAMPPLRGDDVLLYHASTGTRLNFELPKFGGRKVLIYHNITPEAYFQGYNEQLAGIVRYGYEGMRFLSDKVERCVADSEYNRQDLLKMGFRCPIDVCPILIPFDDYDQAPDQGVLRRFGNDGFVNLLFVGRIAPNKRQEDVIRAFYCYHRRYEPRSRLFLVGNSGGLERYEGQLRAYVAKLGLADSVFFTGHISFREILAYYRLADVFVCMSEHEGFCVPLAEAMHFGIPIAARRAAAVPETLGGGGLLLDDDDPYMAAAAVDQLVGNRALRRFLLGKQRERLRDFQLDPVRRRLLGCLGDLLPAK